MIRVNLLRAHGTNDRYVRGCRCSMCGAAHNEYQRRWRAAHPGVYVEQQRIWNEGHPGKHTEYQRRWNAKNPDKVHAAQRRYRESELGRARVDHRTAETRRVYRHLYRESHADVNLRWVAENREKCRSYTRAYKARKVGSSGSHTAADVKAQYERQRGKCFWGRECNPGCAVSLKAGYHVDHVTPLVKRGSNGTENLVLACPSCNCSKGSKHPMEFAGRLL